MLKWLNVEWWEYLLEKPSGGTSALRAIACRAKGHPCGVMWFNPSGYEPNMTCLNCGDDLG